MKKILFLILVLFAFCFTINHKVNAEENFDEDNINSISSSEVITAETFEFMTFEELMSFYNAPITKEVDVENSYYFSNFIMPVNYNQYDTCSLVSLSLLLGYYDTFYNGDFIDDWITYVDKEGKTKQILAIYDGVFDSSFQYETWENISTKYLPVATKTFHDYLVDIAERNNIIEIKEREYSDGTTDETCGGMSDFDSDQVLKKYLIENNISTNLLNFVYHNNVTSIILLDLLEQGIPLRVSIEDYNFYYIKDGKISGKKTSNSNHSIIAYGYIQNEYGTFLKTNFGYEDYDECYVNIDYVKSYSYYEYNGDHVCSNNYHFNYDSNNLNAIIDMCPCQPYEYYFTHTGYNIDENGNEVHSFSYNLEPNITFSLNHVMKKYTNIYTSQHVKRCLFYDYCSELDIEQHYSDNNKYTLLNPTLLDPSNSSGHYMYCSECKYIEFYNHVYEYNDLYSSNDLHRLQCECGYYIDETHSYNIVGDELNHQKICQSCQYEYNFSNNFNHSLTYTYKNDTTHTFECSCSYNGESNHTYTNSICTKCNFEHTNHIAHEYNSNGKRNHNVVCFCGYSRVEKHDFINSGIGMRCKYCGYFTTDPIIVVNIPIENEQMINGSLSKKESEEEIE